MGAWMGRHGGTGSLLTDAYGIPRPTKRLVSRWPAIRHQWWHRGRNTMSRIVVHLMLRSAEQRQCTRR